MLDVLFKGILVSGGLIIAIGSQNVFVLRQGLLGQHVFQVAGLCFLCDVVLMSVGVLGLGVLVTRMPWLTGSLALAGAAFLFLYGAAAFRRAWRGRSQLNAGAVQGKPARSLGRTLLAALAITLLNPHVYLDTVIIVGGVAGTLALDEKVWFLMGAVMASCAWFFGLGYVAKRAAVLFAKPQTWQVLDVCIGLMMWWIAIGLIRYLVLD